MLSVGREPNISDRPIACLACAWEGTGAELATGLLPTGQGALYVYAYRCPACHSFNLNHKGKLLPFRELSPAREERQTPPSPASEHTRLSQRKGKFRR
jgi:hypothetical protein